MLINIEIFGEFSAFWLLNIRIKKRFKKASVSSVICLQTTSTQIRLGLTCF